MKVVELIKKIEKVNEINKEFGFNEVKAEVSVSDCNYRTIKTMKEFKQLIKDEGWQVEEKEVLDKTELTEVDKNDYRLNEKYYIGQWDYELNIRILIFN